MDNDGAPEHDDDAEGPAVAPVASDDFIDSILNLVEGGETSFTSVPTDPVSESTAEPAPLVDDDGDLVGAGDVAAIDRDLDRLLESADAVEPFDDALLSDDDWISADDEMLLDADLDRLEAGETSEAVTAEADAPAKPSAFASALTADEPDESVSTAADVDDDLVRAPIWVDDEPSWADHDELEVDDLDEPAFLDEPETTRSVSSTTSAASSSDQPTFFTPDEIAARKNKSSDAPPSSLGELFASEPRFVIGAAVLIFIGLACIIVGLVLLR